MQYLRRTAPFLVIVFTPFALMAGAWLLYDLTYVQQKSWYGGATHNRGVLFRPPVSIAEHLSASDKRWSLLIPGQALCDTTCRSRLYDTRQVHIALGREAWRLQRIYWSTDEPASELRDFFTEQHRGMQVRVGNNINAIRTYAPQADFYLVDPDGFLMMVYDRSHTGKDLLTDLKFLLKISQ